MSKERVRKEGLVLTRKTNEAIVVSGPARVTIDCIAGNRVLLRVVAEPEVSITRAELLNDGGEQAARAEP